MLPALTLWAGEPPASASMLPPWCSCLTVLYRLADDALDDPLGRTHHPRARPPAAPCRARPHGAGARGHTVVAFHDRTGRQMTPVSWPHVGPERTYRRATTGAHTPASTTRPDGPAAGPRRWRRRRRAARRHNRSVSPPGGPSARVCGPPRGTDSGRSQR